MLTHVKEILIQSHVWLLLYDKEEASEECSGGQSGIWLKYDRHYYSYCQVCVTAHTVGWLMENWHLPYLNYGHIILASPSPILFYPINSTEIRCFVGVPGQHLPPISNGELSRYMITAVAPKLLLIWLTWILYNHQWQSFRVWQTIQWKFLIFLQILAFFLYLI